MLETRHRTAGQRAERDVSLEHGKQPVDRLLADAPLAHLGRDALDFDLVQLVERDERCSMQRLRHAGRVQHFRQQDAVIEAEIEIAETQFGQDLTDNAAQLRFHNGRCRTERVDVALVELTEAPARRTIGAPHRLNLIPLEQLRELALVMRDDTCQRHRQVVT